MFLKHLAFLYIEKGKEIKITAEIYSLKERKGEEGGTKSGTHLGILRFTIILFIYTCLHDIQNVDPSIIEDYVFKNNLFSLH